MSTFRFGRGSLSISIAYVDCRGTESTLAECTYSTRRISSCSMYGGVVGMVCKTGELCAIIIYSVKGILL